MKFGVFHPAVRPRATRTRPRVRALEGWLDPLTVRVREGEIAWIAERLPSPEPSGAIASLVGSAEACREARGRVQHRAEALRSYAATSSGPALREILARHLRVSVSAPRELRRDLAALSRDLDLDALLERESWLVEREGARLEVCLRAIGHLLRRGVELERSEPRAIRLLREVAEKEVRPATRRAAVAALAGSVDNLPDDLTALGTLNRLLRDPEEEPWVRRAAIGAATGLAPELAAQWVDAGLRASGRDAFLLRARAVELLADLSALDPTGEERHFEGWVRLAMSDASELVRATLVGVLAIRAASHDSAALSALVEMLGSDPEARVRARAAWELGGLGAPGLPPLVAALADTPLVVSCALDAIFATVDAGTSLPDSLRARLESTRSDGGPAPGRAAARVLSRVRLEGHPALQLARSLADLRPGQVRSIAKMDVEVGDLADALAIFAYDGFGFAIEPWRAGVRVTRDDIRRPVLWRLLHELRHPGPAKRQGGSHTTGRVDVGPVRVPPAGLAEESATGVPGERLYVEREGGWAPGVPMVDDYLQALGRQQIQIVTTEGVTRVRPPKRLIGRIWARAVLIWRYGHFDALRSAVLAETDPEQRGRYTAALSRLGYQTSQTPRRGASRSYFASVLDPITFALGTSGTSLLHLVVVVLLLAAWLFGQTSVAITAFRLARRRLPLVIGGWGTRGKSGTERLKAGLFEGLGIPFVSKTTGCEARLLHAPPGGHAVELFLFRPFDKATIWEQINVVRFAGDVGARTFLWECMGLNPIYVDLLQNRWMRDDLSTLTNAYPDHEDIQGPTGMDVARAIGGFVPTGALVLTTERNMRPVLADEARGRGSVIQGVSRVDAELLPRDLLARMPHAEHPANVALAAAAAAALGVHPIDAVGLMAEHVVPDLGALMVYPQAKELGRTIVFANGMSANDTLSFRHNWRRMGFDAHDHRAAPGDWLVTLVNNRADRVARSRVFAQILANDAPAHRHVFIGTNLRGLRGYFEQAIHDRLAAHPLGEDPVRVAALFEHLRIVDPGGLAEVCARRLGAAPDAANAWHEAVLALPNPAPDLRSARQAAEQVRATARSLELACGEHGLGLADHLVESLARALAVRAALGAPAAVVQSMYVELALACAVIVEDPRSTGDRTIAAVLATVPPGVHVRLMGVQNIKGTGLDFAYQWVWWRELDGHLADLQGADALRREHALLGIEANPLGTVFACDAVIGAIPTVRAEPSWALRARVLGNKATSRRAELLAARKSRGGARQNVLVRLIEHLLDPFDAILRRRRADRVFTDLAARLISHPRAQARLKALTQRQLGGWLDFGALLRRITGRK